MTKAVDYINMAIVGDFERGYYVSKDDAVKAVEIERKEMIDKVSKWIEEHLYDSVYLFRDKPCTWEHIDDLSILISDLKEAMEVELKIEKS